jgi:sensor histidine kinase YesM
MIIQPFAENAILHGLRLKEGKGKLEISLRLNNDLIECEIIDDGIGRQRSMELNTKTKNKSSLGMQLTRERMEILKQQMNKRSEIRVFDLKDDSNRPTGTKVLLALPFEQDL